MHPRIPPLKKRQRTAAPSSSSVNATIDPSFPPPSPVSLSLSPSPRPRDRLYPVPAPAPLPVPVPGGFNDASSADILLHLYVEDAPDNDNARIYLHSPTLRRARYFDALLSDRWSNDGEKGGRVVRTVNYGVCVGTGTVRDHVSVIKLLYEGDEGLEGGIFDVGTAVRYLPIAVKLLFEDCVRRCLRFIEAVPWSEEEEEVIVGLVPFLSEDESREILARVSLSRRVDDADDGEGEGEGEGLCERMLSDLLVSAKQNNCSNVAQVKAFVARLLREFSSRDSARRVLEDAFMGCLKVVKGSLEEYSSPDFRGDHNETEAIQRLNLHNALTNGKHLLWIIERMIELRVADMAVKEWSEQASFSADLQRAFRDDAWRNIVPGLPTVVLKCTSKLANAVASGTILVARQVRMKFVKDWLPVLIVCKDNSSPVLPSHKPVLHSPTSLYLELEETFLRIISTLPMDDAQELLQQCLSFSTRDSDDCPHLLTAFHTWFRRATRS